MTDFGVHTIIFLQFRTNVTHLSNFLVSRNKIPTYKVGITNPHQICSKHAIKGSLSLSIFFLFLCNFSYKIMEHSCNLQGAFHSTFIYFTLDSKIVYISHFFQFLNFLHQHQNFKNRLTKGNCSQM